MRETENLIGAAFMSASMAAFAINDTIVKFAGADLGVFQTIFVRGLFATTLIGAIALASGAFRDLPRKRDVNRIALRTVTEIGATFCFLITLFNMPIANATAILQSLPLTVTLAAAIFMGERISWRRSLAIICGAIGVLIIIRPGSEGFNAYSLLGLAAVGFVTCRDLLARSFSPGVSSLLVSFITATAITVSAGFALLFFGNWVALDTQTAALLALSAAFVLMGYYFSIATMRHGEIALVTPFRYTAVFWAILLGWLVFGEMPDLQTLSGIFIVLFTGIYTLSRAGAR